ncbi:hypothetical protein [Nonomuraea maheshkhaliensis]|uniref:hypothetical protein n=1 Tax=Nonomuraea maheshkhaliensis TaxID=419590 RepID=UPI0031F94F9E
MIGLVVGLGVLMVAGVVTGGWLLLRAGGGGGPRPEVNDSADRGRGVPSATPGVVAVELRGLTGDQLCEVVPGAYRKTLVADGKYGGKDASTGVATEVEKRAACSWHNSRMEVGGGALGYRSLKISARAGGSGSRNALEQAKEEFGRGRTSHERRVNVRDGVRVDGRTSGSSFGPVKKLDLGDASYSQSSIGHSGLFATVYVREGPWLIEVAYGGDNRTGARYPTGDSVREAAGKVAGLVAAELAKDAGDVKLSGPCAVLTGSDIEAAFFPAVQGPSVGGNSGRIRQTSCTWKISEPVEHEPGRQFSVRGGTLGVRVVDWGKGGSGAAFQFDRAAAKFDRYHAKGGIGDARLRTDYEARQNLPGLGEKAFAVVSATYRPGRPEEGPVREVQVQVLVGERTIEFSYRGTNTGGGLVDEAGYRAPALDPSGARASVVRLAKILVSGIASSGS